VTVTGFRGFREFRFLDRPGIQAMSCSPPTVVCSRRMRADGNGGQGRHEQYRCHSLTKVLQCWWAPAAASLLTLARRCISYQITLTAATTSSQTDRRGSNFFV